MDGEEKQHERKLENGQRRIGQGLVGNVQHVRLYSRSNAKPGENAMLGFAFYED